MAWGFKKSIKIAPGVRINLSKSGVSASLGGKGFTYNTRGRITTSIPGTGIRHTQNIAARRTTKPVGSALRASAHIDSDNTDRLSKREMATREFVTQLQSRTTKALQEYFISHGVYVHVEDLVDAATLEDHQEFLTSLTQEFETTTKAIKLGIDIGSISLAEKEKAMRALYEIEEKCSSHQGNHGALEDAAASLQSKVLAWPISPAFFWPILLSLVGCTFFLTGNSTAGLILIVGPGLYGFYKLKSFEKRKNSLLAEITEADGRFQSLLVSEISPRPALPNIQDNVQRNATIFAGITAALALVAACFYLANTGSQTLPSGANSTASDDRAKNQNKPAAQISSPAPSHSEIDFTWLVGKPPSDAVKDRRFKAAFNGVSAAAWKKIADRLTVSNVGGVQVKDGYYFGAGCKAHFCDSDIAAFAINQVIGKGDVIYKETTDYNSNEAVAKGFIWTDLPIDATPLAAWAISNNMSSSTAAPSQSSSVPNKSFPTSFNCNQAGSDVERLICSDQELAERDVELATVFAEAKAHALDQTTFKERARKAWNYREKNCHDRECIARWYSDQKAALKEMINDSQ